MDKIINNVMFSLYKIIELILHLIYRSPWITQAQCIFSNVIYYLLNILDKSITVIEFGIIIKPFKK